MDLEIKLCVDLSARGVDGGADHSQAERSARVLVELSKEVFVGFDGFALHGDDHVARANTRLLCRRRGHNLLENSKHVDVFELLIINLQTLILYEYKPKRCIDIITVNKYEYSRVETHVLRLYVLSSLGNKKYVREKCVQVDESKAKYSKYV